MRLATIALVTSALSVAASPACAQRADSLTVGARVRVLMRDTMPTEAIASWEGMAPDGGIVLRYGWGADGTASIARARIVALQVSRSRLSRREGMRRGMTIGLAVGGVVTVIAVAAVAGAVGGFPFVGPFLVVGTLGTGVVLTAVAVSAGAAAGAAQGRSSDEWVDVPLP